MLLFNSISFIAEIIGTVSFYINTSTSSYSVFFEMIILIVLYLSIIKILLFNSDWVIDKLKLDKNFKENKITLTLSYHTVLSIGLILIGITFFISSFSVFCLDLFNFLQQKELFNKYPDAKNLIFNFVKSLLGYWLFTNSMKIVSWFPIQEKNIS